MRLFDAVLEFACPTRCAGCDLPGTLLCRRCEEALRAPGGDRPCPRCGAPYGFLTCTECWESSFAFEGAVCVGSLERPLSRCVTLYKDAGERRLAGRFGEMLAGRVSSWGPWADAVTFVPASPAARARRGFDHGESLGSAVAHALGIPLLAVLRPGDSVDQRGLSRASRHDNASLSVVTCGVVLPDRMLLVDDVFTTGATLDAGARALLEAGVLEVRVGAVARAW